MDNNNEQNQSTYVQNDTGTTINTGTVLNEEKKDKKGFSIAALVLGIIAIVLSCVWYVSVPAVQWMSLAGNIRPLAVQCVWATLLFPVCW